VFLPRKTPPVLSFDLLANSIVSGLLLGGFYAGVAAGATISFGLLDVANIAHPAFVVFGAYSALLASERLGLDPLRAALIIIPTFYVAGCLVYQVYHQAFERRGNESMRGLAFFFGLMFGRMAYTPAEPPTNSRFVIASAARPQARAWR
jgi:branched-chain amino acid transport system permease protein